MHLPFFRGVGEGVVLICWHLQKEVSIALVQLFFLRTVKPVNTGRHIWVWLKKTGTKMGCHGKWRYGRKTCATLAF